MCCAARLGANNRLGADDSLLLGKVKTSVNFKIDQQAIGLFAGNPCDKLTDGDMMNQDVLLFGASTSMFAAELGCCKKVHDFRAHAG